MPKLWLFPLALAAACSNRTPVRDDDAATSSGGAPASAGAPAAAGVAGQAAAGGDHGGASGAGGQTACAAVEAPADPRPFIHPGGLHKRSDLERMRYQVAAGREPWKTSFERLSSDARASATYEVRGDAAWTEVQRGGLHGAEYESDATAAYLNALMWAITGDEAHARKCVEIFDTWKNLRAFVAPGTPALDAGLFAYKLVEAAEIIQATYDGWPESNRQAFKDMLVFPGYSSREVPASVGDAHGTFYWRIYNGDPGRHGNQDLIAWRAMLTMGVFLDNRVMFERALRYFKGEPHRPDDLPYPAGPAQSGAQLADNAYFTSYQAQVSSAVPDYGYNGVLQHYIWENGQSQESSRDQQHALFGLGVAAGIAEVAWNQGDGVWNAHDARLLKGFEFVARYNASLIASFPDQLAPWEPTADEVLVRTDRTGRWRSKAINPYFESDFTKLSRGDFPGKRPIFEQGLAHFQRRMSLPASATLWTARARDVAIEQYGQEPNGFSLDHPGWGALTFHRPVGCAGDPVSGFDAGLPVFAMNVVPGAILAANYDYFPVAGEGLTYHDLSAGNAGQHYRNDDVDLTCSPEGPLVTDLAAGEWLSYTLAIPEAGSYVLEVRYRVAAAGARLSFLFDGSPGATLPLPASPELATSSVKLSLGAGVQSLRLLVDSSADALELASFTLRAD